MFQWMLNEGDEKKTVPLGSQKNQEFSASTKRSANPLNLMQVSKKPKNGSKQSFLLKIFTSCQQIGFFRVDVNRVEENRLLEWLKQFPGSTKLVENQPDSNSSSFQIPLTCYAIFLEKFSNFLSQQLKYPFDSYEIHEIPKHILHFAHSLAEFSPPVSPQTDALRSKLGAFLYESLTEYQKACIQTAIHFSGRLLIADEMGLGKSVEALCVAKYFEQDWPLLIITPSSLRFTWKKEILKWFPDMSPDLIFVVMDGKFNFSAACADPRKDAKKFVVITSYALFESISKDSELIRQFQMMIVDESHFLKSINSKRTKLISPYLKKAKRLLLLSGTPALSRPIELFPQLSCLDPKFFTKYHEFGIRYCDGKKSPYFGGWDMSGHSNLNELLFLLTSKFMIRRLKSDVLKQLPPKRRQCVYLKVPSCPSNLKKMTLCLSLSEGPVPSASMMDLYRHVGGLKIKPVLNYLKDLFDSQEGGKFLVFAHHTSVMDSISEWLTAHSVNFIQISGKTNIKERETLCHRFQQDPECRVALLSITAAGVGLTFTAANTVVFAELYWNPGTLLQAEDRVHRIGQDHQCVSIKYLLGLGTVDEVIWEMIHRKIEVVSQSMDHPVDANVASPSSFSCGSSSGSLTAPHHSVNPAKNPPKASHQRSITAYFRKSAPQ
eukprot:Sdes_comp20839_c0_seq2m17519